jgi:hypothetical protein
MDTQNPDLPEDDDPIVAEVRRIREEIAARFDYDFARINEYARQVSARIREERARRRSESQR